MTYFCLGFAFDIQNPSHVLLIRKNRPKWQAGLLNGVGGHVEPGETLLEAMVREFQEETGISTVFADWRKVATLFGPGKWRVACYTADLQIQLADFERTDEPLSIEAWPKFTIPAVPNLLWLVPLCRDELVRTTYISEYER